MGLTQSVQSEDAYVSGVNRGAENPNDAPKEDDPDYLIPSIEAVLQLEDNKV